MNLKTVIPFILIVFVGTVKAQQLTGTLKYQAGQEIKLLGYAGFKTIALGKTVIDSDGSFVLNYDATYKGMGYLETADKSQLFVVINEPTITINGSHLKEPDSIQFVNSLENKAFVTYAKEHSQREQALSAWKYLLPQYQSNSILKNQTEIHHHIVKEINRLEKEDADYLKNINSSYYVSWFLPLRKLLSDIPISAQHHTERIPKHLVDFREINFKDDKLYHSGIFDDLIETHYWLLENSGMTLDSMYLEMNNSTDYLISNLEGNDKLLNEVTDFLFDLLERRSLFKASEYLALKMLTQNSCILNDDLSKQLETYRVMKVGNTAPDILFSGTKILKGVEILGELKLSTMNNKYTLVVFGASWCPKCTEEIPKIKTYYDQWKQKGVEVVFVSLDTEKKEFVGFVNSFPFLSVCDFNKWKSKPVKDYYVFSTPTLFLLDKDRKILVRPSSVKQVDAWVNYKLEQL